ncbi:MAG: NCS2 family permease [Acidobacteriota bacterium]|nr:NCS2 family permease [Acidobacteriota bacterium]
MRPLATRAASAPVEPWFTSGDVDGFFGLFFSGFPDLLLIVALAPLCGFPAQFVAGRILPGAAVSVLAGNIFYALQARRLARLSGRSHVTAIPFGVNTPTIFAYVFLIMGPVFASTHDPELAWHAGIFACLLSGAVQTLCAFGADWLRRNTPSAALLAPIAGLSLAYLCMGFVFGVFDQPAVALLPMIVLFALYGANLGGGLRLPYRIPPALLAISLGALLVFAMRRLNLYTAPLPLLARPSLYLPHIAGVLGILAHPRWWGFLSIILPLSLLDVAGGLMILESARLAGDDFATRPSLLTNGLATMLAATLGSPFPTTLYIGHAAHKANGARSGYSLLNGAVTFVLCVSGVLPLVLRVVPIEVAAPVILWFGLITVGQAFSEVPRNHGVAVAMGLLPLLAQWAATLLDTVLRAAGSSLARVTPHLEANLAIAGIFALGQGALLISLVWAAAIACILDRRFAAAAAWLAAAAALSALGLIHAYTLTEAGLQAHLGWWVAPRFSLVYLAGTGVLLLLHRFVPHLSVAPQAE